MTWVAEPIGYANPDYYRDAADSAERQLRADFAKYYQLREIAPYGLTPADTAEMTAHADTLAGQWGRHDTPHWRHTWETLRAAVTAWETRPDAARRHFDHLAHARRSGDLTVDDSLWRSLEQARAITGHGTDAITGSTQDAAHRFPNLNADRVLTERAPSVESESDLVRDSRTAVERTLGVPRDRTGDTGLVSFDQVAETIDATEDALYAEERVGDLDSGREARAALLPRSVREAPIHFDYGHSEAWELQQAAMLREIQDLACEHTNLADGFDGHDDQARIRRLEALRDGLGSARRDALRAGVPAPEVDRAYVLGRDGIYWSNEPSHPRLGRMAQLFDERDRARAEAATLRTQLSHSAGSQNRAPGTGPGDETGYDAADFADAENSSYREAGARIVEAIDAVLADADLASWTDTSPVPQEPAAAHSEINRGSQL